MMQLLSTMIALCVVLYFEGTAQSYVIDYTSCDAPTGKYQFVKELVEQAFTMAAVTSSAVSANPMDGYTTFLIGQLFNLPNTNAQEEILRTIDQRTADDGTVTGIMSFREEKTGHPTYYASNEVVIFCDEKRLQKAEDDDTKMYDSVIGHAQDKNTFCKYSFMYTERFRDRPDTIQICPWFLEYARAQKYHTTDNLESSRAKLAVAGVDKLITKFVYRPIDLLSLWDKCMLHEMMHTKAAGKKNDTGGFGGYGWKNCKKLSTTPKCYENADSFAILNSALYWNSQGRQIDADGKFTTPPSTSTKKRWSWLGSGAGRGAGIVKLDEMDRFV